ncbi:uncharacterized protein LOC144629020 [Oculina patagonica]
MTSKTDSKKAGPEAQNIADEKARKEELVEARIKAARKKNEELMKRQQEIEEDRKNADKYSEMAVKKHHEHATAPSGVAKESPPAGGGRGRGRGLMLQEMRKETLKAKQWEAKRKENIKREEEERNRESKTSSSMSRFLADDNRVDMSRTTGRNEHSWGGANFNKVVNRVQRDKEGFRSGRGKGNIEMTMSGKERQEYYQWREERKKIDEERKIRQKKTGNWSRAWDQKKIWDSRKKMWVYEDENDEYNDTRRRKESDDSEDWGSDNRNSGHVNRGREKRDQGSRQGFVAHDDRNVEASEEWGETNEEVVTHKVSGSQFNEADTKLNHQHGAVSASEDWEEGIPVTLDNKVESSATSKEMTSDHKESNAPEPQKELERTREIHDSEANDQPNDSRESHKETESATVVTSDLSHSDAPKPQRQVKQRRKQQDSEANVQLESSDFYQEQEFVLEEKHPSDKNNLHEPPTSDKELAVADKDQHTHRHVDVGSQLVSDDLENGDDDGVSNNTVTMNNDKGGIAPKTPVDEQQITTIHSEEEVSTNVDKDSTSHPSQAQKANLPKLLTKVDKKVTFDTSEESDLKKDTESKDSAVSLDIPPTPDFLKVDKSVDWGDFEIDEEEVVERW